jgi:hypothetical protein
MLLIIENKYLYDVNSILSFSDSESSGIMAENLSWLIQIQEILYITNIL